MDIKKKLIFFDFDGVIADSFDAALAVNKMIFPGTSVDEYRKRFDGNINETAENPGAKKEYRADIDFFAEYEPLLLKSSVFPGMVEVVRKLGDAYLLVVISSSLSSSIEKFLTIHQLNDCFAEIMGNDVHKSKITKIEMALAKHEIPASDCLFITDTTGDIKEARHMNIKAIAVTWGYQSKESLKIAEPFAVVDTPKELAEILLV